jgi:hypothetical protein
MIMRTIRAVLLTALTWGVAWAGVGALLGLYQLVRAWSEDYNISGFLAVVFGGPMLILGVAGVLSGATFAILMSGAERGKTLSGLATWRAGVWGAVGGLAFSAGLIALMANQVGLNDPASVAALRWVGIATTLGVLSATGSLAIARKGTPGLLEEAAAMQRLGGAGGGAG